MMKNIIALIPTIILYRNAHNSIEGYDYSSPKLVTRETQKIEFGVRKGKIVFQMYVFAMTFVTAGRNC